jgi:uncharacterized protein (TIGR01777 family)
MKVVLTGGTGLIGQALHQRLIREGYEVAVLSRPHWNGERDIAPAEILRGCDVVIHLAGENVASQRWSKQRKKHLIDSRITSAKNLNDGLIRAGVKLKIFMTASAVGIYGDRGDELLDEDSTPGHDFLAELCQKWEAAADQVAAAKTVKLRFGVVLSAHGGFLARVSGLFKRLGASRLSSGKQWFSWIHIDDLVEAIVWTLAPENQGGPFNIVAPHPVTNAQLTQELKLALGAFSAPPVPAFALRLLYGELAGTLMSSQRVLPRRLEAKGFQWKYPTLSEALKAASESC